MQTSLLKLPILGMNLICSKILYYSVYNTRRENRIMYMKMKGYLNKLILEGLQCKEREWDHVHEDGRSMNLPECNVFIQDAMHS